MVRARRTSGPARPWASPSWACLDAAGHVRIDVGAALGLLTERNGATLARRRAALSTADCPLVEGLVFHGLLPLCRHLPSAPSTPPSGES
ncbi:hypothetical protein SAM23877_7614 [Streptomyces ambofaciens ATCC 23877]|uniref:Transposase n=1 Tax=Streptomyces ambofaciens (strain ATCC 23877 / 3486 / DSM 40053 / JCM 4204 / NBRC 12836 / NRRL B-2516) TaxID=278992 RepID=A0A0K2B5H7_STRA7|nr:hypothetical protein SAM23877_0057 [Streptomyces ambofaciens ATCC 23877]AKZ60655.1 hypothetical protein SAM23877_7614 [Streptomyces ambofaciens ATCC 23877]